jgi:hypothetical protein
MTKNTMRKAAFVFTKEEQASGETETVQLAVPIPRSEGRWPVAAAIARVVPRDDASVRAGRAPVQAVAESALRIEFANGSRIVALPGESDATAATPMSDCW